MRFRICYQRCDPQYETVPHIHTEDGIFTVDEELTALERSDFRSVILNDIPSFTRMNGENVALFQSCGECNTRYVGNQNFAYCPTCGHMLIRTIDA